MHLGDRLVLIGAHQDYGGSQRLGAERLPTPFDLHVRFRVGAVEAHRLEPLLFSVDKHAARIRREVRMVSIFGGGDRRGRAAACRDRDELPGGFGGDRGRGRAEGPRGAPQGNNSISVRPVARLAIEGHPTRDACRRSPLYGQRVQVPKSPKTSRSPSGWTSTESHDPSDVVILKTLFGSRGKEPGPLLTVESGVMACPLAPGGAHSPHRTKRPIAAAIVYGRKRAVGPADMSLWSVRAEGRAKTRTVATSNPVGESVVKRFLSSPHEDAVHASNFQEAPKGAADAVPEMGATAIVGARTRPGKKC